MGGELFPISRFNAERAEEQSRAERNGRQGNEDVAAEAVRLALVGADDVSRRCFMNNPGSVAHVEFDGHRIGLR